MNPEPRRVQGHKPNVVYGKSKLLNMKKIILTTVLLVLFSVVSVSLAQYGNEPVAPTVSVTLWGTNSILTKATNWFFGIVIAIAAIMLISAGFTYILSGGNEEKMKTALNSVIYALIGVAIALLAKGLVYLICNLLGTTACSFF